MTELRPWVWCLPFFWNPVYSNKCCIYTAAENSITLLSTACSSYNLFCECYFLYSSYCCIT